MTDLGYLPLFQVKVGNTEELRFFYEAVLPGLEKQNIHSAVVTGKEGECCGRLPVSSWLMGVSSTLYIGMRGQDPFTLLPDLFRHVDIIFCLDEESAVDSTFHSFPFPVADFLDNEQGAIKYLVDIASSGIQQREIWACILIGGKSSRMGQPKHLLPHHDGRSWLERNIALIQDKVAGVAISGKGDLPPCLQHHLRLQDVPGVQGPLTGLISATRWMPNVSWLVFACDLPMVSAEAIDWLIGDRRPGCWAKIPTLRGQQRGEPLLARYEPQCGPLFETMARSGNFSLHRIFSNNKVDLAEVPAPLEQSWRNVNTPSELEELKRGMSHVRDGKTS
ncbi:molybdenum cofactor guanylyltransferase [Desulfopila sp. IMCC35008]|uniref:molybdenum cofactor guanylyltransferase n=1 Tax=Desulfopila sp. IMCC35008 TaxID=2653858 RepID=UPI0013D58189|nr:molybdenum cofactor guanylyltransferase [Desulfopila sp. IMCC35008]